MNRPADRRPWTFFLLLGLAILILALHETGQLELLEDLLSLVTGPIQRTLSSVVEGVSGTFSSVGDARELQAQVDELEALARDLAAEGVRLKEVEAENAQLRELLNFVSANPSIRGYIGGDIIDQSGLVGSEVIGRDPNPYVSFVIINRGRQDGLEQGMPVVAGGGRLVGRIDEVRPRWAKVQLLIDPSSRVNGMVQASRATGLVAGQPDGALVLEQVPQADQVGVGDTVVTSGRGGLLPKGLIIGQVLTVEQLNVEAYQQAQLQPAVDFRRLESVLVITDFEPLALDEAPAESNP
jgi:rod shape-determining protein MreC